MSEDTIDVARIEDVLLLRASLSKALERPKLLATVGKLLAVPKPLLEQRVEALVESGHLKITSGARARTVKLTATELGRDRWRARFGGNKPRDWRAAQKLIVAQALGVPAGQFKSKHDRLIPELVRRQAGLDKVRELATEADVLDALVLRELGIDGPGKLTLAKVRAAILAEVYDRAIPARRKQPKDIALDFVAAELGAQRNSKDSVEAALASRWVRGASELPRLSEPESEPEPPAAQVEVVAPRGPASEGPPKAPVPAVDLSSFAAQVQGCADRLGAAHRFGDDKVYIASVWRSLGLGDLDGFKRRLLEAHQRRLLRLLRADLVLHMDRALLDESELRYLNAQFHFIESRRRFA